MAIQLLYPKGQEADSAAIDPKIVYHFSLDRSFESICPRKTKREHFLSVLTELPTNPAIPLYRQEVLTDFVEHPNFFSAFADLQHQLDELYASHKKNERSVFRMQIDGTSSDASAKNIIQARALCLTRLLAFAKSFENLLTETPIRSQGLSSFRDRCQKLTGNNGYIPLLQLANKYTNYSLVGNRDCKVWLCEDGSVASCQLLDHRHIYVTDPDLKPKIFSRFSKKSMSVHPCQRVYPAKNNFSEAYTKLALSNLSALFSSLCTQLFDLLMAKPREMDFYEVSLQYIAFLKEKKIVFCQPSFSEFSSFHIVSLQDLLLLQSLSPEKVVPHHIHVHDFDGIAVFGDNGSGKTVFLRSLGTAQLLAQNGLPVPAEQAVFPLCTQIATHFSEAETGTEAGRFEQEVKALATMVEGLQPGALVFLNETFQSTAYTEGSLGLYDLLQHFSCSGIHWVLVSHLTDLKTKLSEEDVFILHTQPGYKIT